MSKPLTIIEICNRAFPYTSCAIEEKKRAIKRVALQRDIERLIKEQQPQQVGPTQTK